jgi:glycosyl transferase family 4
MTDAVPGRSGSRTAGRLRVLITNVSLWYRSGTELYTRDLAIGLARRGHSPVVYSTQLGTVADELRRATVPVVDDLAAIGVTPDVIHAHHTLETMAAGLRFPATPALFVCHDAKAWHDTPPPLPQIRHWVAVDRACHDRLTLQHGIPEDRVRLLPNAVDLNRFRPRKPLPDRPGRALLFSNYAGEAMLQEVQAACAARSITLDTLGHFLGDKHEAPETVLPQYDLVFAKGRSALEAAAVGAAVIVCDPRGCGPLVTTDRLEEFRFSGRMLGDPVRCDTLLSRIDQYDPHDAGEVARRVRAECNLEGLLDRLESLYREVMEEAAPPPSADELLECAAEGYRWWAASWLRLLKEHAAPSLPALPDLHLPPPPSPPPTRRQIMMRRCRQVVRSGLDRAREAIRSVPMS